MFVLIYIICSLSKNYADSSQYDQRQTGDVNVQVDFKDVHIFALLKGNKEEYVDYDYAYDYSELTIKPQNRTTPKPLNSTTTSTEPTDPRDNTTIATTILQEHTIALINNEITTLGYTVAPNVTDKDDYTTTMKTDPVNTTDRLKETVTAVTVPPNRVSTRKNCRKGYFLNQKGQCQLQISTTENALLKLVKLSQKLKLRRENKSNDHS